MSANHKTVWLLDMTVSFRRHIFARIPRGYDHFTERSIWTLVSLSKERNDANLWDVVTTAEFCTNAHTFHIFSSDFGPGYIMVFALFLVTTTERSRPASLTVLRHLKSFNIAKWTAYMRGFCSLWPLLVSVLANVKAWVKNEGSWILTYQIPVTQGETVKAISKLPFPSKGTGMQRTGDEFHFEALCFS